MIEEYAASVYSALIKDLSEIEYETYDGWGVERKRTGTKTRRSNLNEIEIYSFPQTWGSTALGFGGIGGAAMTTALTVVVFVGREACVYFGGQFAYKIKKINETFMDDMRTYNMHAVNGARGGRYEA